MKFLLIEDDEEKCEKISRFLSSNYSEFKIEIANSFNAGLRAIIRTNPGDILLLDMSMPTFNVTIDDPSGGTPEHFAGRDILAQMKLRNIQIPTIVITMFDLFGDSPDKMSFPQLESQLSNMFSPYFRGMVYYNSAQEGWKNSLSYLIDKII